MLNWWLVIGLTALIVPSVSFSSRKLIVIGSLSFSLRCLLSGAIVFKATQQCIAERLLMRECFVVVVLVVPDRLCVQDLSGLMQLTSPTVISFFVSITAPEQKAQMDATSGDCHELASWPFFHPECAPTWRWSIFSRFIMMTGT